MDRDVTYTNTNTKAVVSGMGYKLGVEKNYS